MRITARLEYSASPDEVFAAVADPAFQAAKCDATSLGQYTVDVTDRGDRTVVTTERHLPSGQLPAFVQSFVGKDFTISETQDWGPLQPDGSRVCDLRLHVAGTPLTLTGTVTMRAGGPGTVEDVEADLRANVPLIGGRIEQAAAEPIRDAIRIEGEVLESWVN